MMYRPSRWTVAALAFAVVVGFITWLIFGRGERVMRFADGREFSVVAVTYGTNHVLESGPPWARLLHRYGSASLAHRLGYKASGPFPSPLPSIMVWTRWSLANTNSAPLFASVADVHGARTEPNYVLSTQSPSPERIGTHAAWRFDNYPRHQKEFTLLFYKYDLFRLRAHLEGQVVIRNPFPTENRPERAPTAPVTATNGILECTLVSLRCGGAPPRHPLTAKHAIVPWVTAAFDFLENGQPTTDWTVRRIAAFGSGNYFAGERLMTELEQGRRVAHFTGTFWQDEPDWRLMADVTPTRNFPRETLWTVRLTTRSFLDATLSTNLPASGRGLRNFSLALGPANVDLRPKSPERHVAFLHASFTPTAPDIYVDIAGAVDDRTRNLDIATSVLSRTHSLEANLELQADAQWVDLTFAIHRSVKMEFHVRPEFVSTNASLNKP